MKIFRITFFLFFISKIALAQFLVFPDYDATLIKPIVKGLSHPQVCVAPDGLYYLTGTTGDPKDDFENDGIHMWKSKDLQHWEEMGKVFDVSEITWQNRGEPVYGTYHSKRKNGCRGAELHFIKGAYYLVYSTVYQSIGILKSKTGKPEGPYEDLGKLLPWGYDPSLFEDSDGTVFLTWNG